MQRHAAGTDPRLQRRASVPGLPAPLGALRLSESWPVKNKRGSARAHRRVAGRHEPGGQSANPQAVRVQGRLLMREPGHVMTQGTPFIGCADAKG
ncbi:MAG: hypothetical protein D6690_12315 [Nitrospirae bacterium]|nr:MAG: hypothetical protein D6690_12315 [Nitrospirota bacterium]